MGFIFNFAISLVKTKTMANKYELRKFEPVNNKTYQFHEVSVNGKYLFQEFVENLKDQRDIKKLINIYSYMDMLSASMLPKSKFRHIDRRIKT